MPRFVSPCCRSTQLATRFVIYFEQDIKIHEVPACPPKVVARGDWEELAPEDLTDLPERAVTAMPFRPDHPYVCKECWGTFAEPVREDSTCTAPPQDGAAPPSSQEDPEHDPANRCHHPQR